MYSLMSEFDDHLKVQDYGSEVLSGTDQEEDISHNLAEIMEMDKESLSTAG